MTITINGIEYTIRLDQGKCEVEYFNSVTGLNSVLCFYKFPEFNFASRRVESLVIKYDITPTGIRINPVEYRYPLSEQDFLDFENTIGVIMKKSIVNGIFRNVVKNTYRIYDESLGVINEQPVAFPEAGN